MISKAKENAENNEYDISIYQSVRYLVLDKQTNLNKLIQDYNSKLTKELFINKFELCKQMRITMDKDINYTKTGCVPIRREGSELSISYKILLKHYLILEVK